MKALGDLIKHWLSDHGMKNKNVVLSSSVVNAAEKDFANPELYEAEEAREVVLRVNRAVRLIAEKGEAAFAELRQAPWYDGERYIFVMGLQGVGKVNPPAPQLEGVNGLELKDSWGTQMIKQYLDDLNLRQQNSTWVHYFGINPTNLQEEWKSSFVMKAMAPDGSGYAVGSGVYNMKLERALVGDELKDACEMIEKNGAAALEQLKTKDYFRDTLCLFDK
ncbi:MAG TPA: cache domain-containing protein [Patescibacteria group bacterium]|nr:cache domain-containing protein [Patescibacteria group bacterium]